MIHTKANHTTAVISIGISFIPFNAIVAIFQIRSKTQNAFGSHFICLLWVQKNPSTEDERYSSLFVEAKHIRY
jgi:hypothetical protein